ncbi:LysR family transcriptional regulator [Dasania sp. GY-MA-18]|uniref:LysR family transcriptional regulator n=1 Tax=Dasania phycosphaerae TaxID=2950436 RepID=A0A9J6RN92_9GAMM|nr:MULTISPECIES: LysR family transcriptional regulator [Dasania]MCR8923530.1 LysR family transcriptional regulator [Dasania sp. GY-MA-18]MCZ0865964.1 LysR family transcriptional regulator [Dasania phycosphaerae]MCZ0869688.1 LysR family transcriptional regulator [Dasania phycosphaerae]
MSTHNEKPQADWNDIHIAYQVAICGTLTAAAEALGVHHSTVLRRVNALEQRLGTKLFHRHARGYVPTEAGLLLTQTAENTQNHFDRLLGQLQSTDSQLTGSLVITSVNSLSDYLIPLLAEFCQRYPQIKLEFAAESRVLKLEHGEAHVGIRPGKKPSNPDYVVQHLAKVASSLYGSAQYVAKHGLMQGLEYHQQHRFVSTIAPFSMVAAMRWMNDTLAAEQITMRVSDFTGFVPAIRSGFGIAPLNCWQAYGDNSLRPMLSPPPEWQFDLWLTTHGDMHRSAKVQAFTQFLKQRFAEDKARLLGAF